MSGDQSAAASGWRSFMNRAVGGSLFATGALQLMVIVSGVLIARGLGPEDRGHLALLVVVSTVCAALGTMGLPLAATYYIAHDQRHARRITSSLLRMGVFLGLAALAVQVAVLTALVVDEPRRVKVAAVISLLLVPGIVAFAFGIAILQGQQRFGAFNFLRVLPTASYVVGVFVVFMVHSADLDHVMAIWSGAYFLGGFLALGVALRGLPLAAPADEPVPSRSRMTAFGLKSLFGSLSPVDALRLDQIVVGLFLAPAALGLYVVAQAFTNLPRVIAASIGMVGYPQVAAQHDRAAARRTMWRYFFLGSALSALAVGGLEVLAGKLVPLFFGSEFSEATSIARILILGTFFVAARRVLTDGVNGLGHPGLGTLAEVASWVLLVPSLAILLPRFGVDGVALALTFSWAVSLLLLLAMVGIGEARQASARRHWEQNLVRSWLSHRPSLVTRYQLLGLAVAVGAASAAGIAVAVLPMSTALIAIAVLSAMLFFAFGRAALGRKTRLLRSRLERMRSTREDLEDGSSSPAGAEMRVARWLYYLGLVILGVLTVRAGGTVTFSDVLFLFSFLFACAELAVTRRRVPMTLPFLLFLGMAIFSFGGLLSTLNSYAPLNSTAVVARLIFLTVFWFWLATIVLKRREHVITALSFWVASAAICGFAGAIQTVAGDGIPWTGTMAFGRATGFTTHPNELGGLTAVAFVPALMLAARQHISGLQRLVSYLLLMFVGAGLILSGSVGAFLAAAAATFAWIAFTRTSAQSMLVFAALGACVLGLVTVQAMRGGPTPLSRFDRVLEHPAEGQGAGSLDSRIAIYRVATAAIKEHPFVGVGLDLVSVTRPFGIVSDEYDVHNLMIGIWYKAGLLGLVGMLLALFAIFRAGWIGILQSRTEAEQATAIALVSSLLAFVVFAMSEPVLFARFGWISAALLLAFRAVQRESSFVPVSWRRPDLQEVALEPARP